LLETSGFDDLQKDARSYAYYRIGLSSSETLIQLILLAALYFTSLSRGLVDYLTDISNSKPVQFILYFTIYFVLLYIFEVAFSYYKGFVIEHRFGFSTQNLRDWIKDEIKRMLLGYIISIILFALLFLGFDLLKGNWWLGAALAVILINTLAANLLPIILIPLFYKLARIEDENLINILIRLNERAGIRVKGFYEMNTSSKSNKQNAMLVGLFNTRRVVIGDTLLNEAGITEIESVIAHELGHHKRMHLPKMLILSSLHSFLLFFILQQILTYFVSGFPASFSLNLTALPLFILLSILLEGFLKPFYLYLSRRFEVEADRAVFDYASEREAFTALLTRLAIRNKEWLSPPKWMVWFFYTHPPVAERIKVFNDWLEDAKPRI
jgi:STE24 endopeptidase